MKSNARGRERRAVVRYTADGSVTLGWWHETEFQTEPFTMLDVSQGGAKGLAERAPEPGVPAWLMVPNRTEARWVRSSILSVIRPRHGPLVIRLRFEENCPYDLFRLAVRGVTLQAEVRPPEEEHWRDNTLWR